MKTTDLNAGSNARAARVSGYGPGYCYVGTVRFVHVVADSLELARVCCCPAMRLAKVRGYRANPKRAHFIFAR